MKSIKKLRTLIPMLALLTLVSGCQNTPISSVVDSSASSSAENSQGSSGSALPEWVDYVHDGEVHLQLDYQGKNFLTDGIQQVSLKTAIDGDTAHFVNADGTGSLIKARYYGIDTPESTGKVQPYGRGASDFNKEKLKEANENGTIVISGVNLHDYAAPEPDSTGSRYVSLIWINTEKKNAPANELVLLNLWIVQEGWSNVKNVLDIPEYSDVFYAAEKQAQDYKLNLFSGEDDPLFNYGDYEDASLLDIKKEIIASLEDPTHVNAYDNKKVRVVGTVAGYSNRILYLQNYDPETGEYAGINFFVGMTEPSTVFKTRNAYIECCGLALESENFGFQLTDGNFNVLSTLDNAAKLLIKASENVDEYALYTHEFKPTELKNADYDVLNCFVKLTENVKVTGGYYNEENNQATLYVSDMNGNRLDYSIFVPFNYRPAGSSWSDFYTSIDDFRGKVFQVQGVYTYHKTTKNKISWQINLSSADDLVLVDGEGA